VNHLPTGSDLTRHYSAWKRVRFASTPATGAWRFQKSTKSLDIVIPSKIAGELSLAA